ncbi:manganese-dependent ADP-ribose/CDP-alcohol diphosphatase-like [Pelobates fuscus]|uniref:manganese-dependent ADP-ribose/CDP-alcohol diphosphatase-like n=1 Tax=Pelobates fuscus TaxID=191477 RepID=UPI002FE4E533
MTSVQTGNTSKVLSSKRPRMAEQINIEEGKDGTQQPYFTFGVIADIQYADRPDGISGWRTMRFYRQSLLHLRQAIDEWKTEDIPLQFVLQLGDIIDACNACLCQSTNALQVVLKEIKNIDVPFHHIWGNHELLNFDRIFLADSPLNTMFMADEQKPGMGACISNSTDCFNYYAYHFSPFPNFRFILVDSYDLSVHGRDSSNPKYLESSDYLHGNYQSNESEGNQGKCSTGIPDYSLPQLKEFNGGFSSEQLSWLHNVLTFSDERRERVVIAGHIPIHPKTTLKTCLAWNYIEMLTLIHSHPSVVSYLAGHHHNGGYHKDSHGIYHVTMEGVIESPAGTNAFATVSVYGDRMVLNGRGRVKSRVFHYQKWPSGNFTKSPLSQETAEKIRQVQVQ